MALPLLIGYKIEMSTEICAQWRIDLAPSAQITHGRISSAIDSKVVDLRAYARKRIDRELTVKTGDA